MMKIRVISDLHLEFAAYDLPVVGNEKEQVLVLAGDIGLTKYPQYTIKVLEDYLKRFRAVIYVAGNHESYNSNIDHMDKLLRELSFADNYFYLQNDNITIDNILFVGATFWTDFGCSNGYGAYTYMQYAERHMNDFHIIKTNTLGTFGEVKERSFKPIDSVNMNTKSRDYFHKMLDISKDKKVIFVTHHAPHVKSIHDRYYGSSINGAFANNGIDHFDRKKAPVLWIHGHMHDSFDYKVEGTRVVCNPRGYRDGNEGFNPELVIEV